MPHNVVLEGSGPGLTLRVADGTTVLEALRGSGVRDFAAPCGGAGRCGKCRAKIRGKLSAPTAAELEHLSRDELAAGYRLACQARLLGDAAVERAMVGRSSILASGKAAGFAIGSASARGIGAGVDLGTTTIVAHLVDLASGDRLATLAEANDQRSYGEDVIARIDAAASPDGLQRLQRLGADQIASLISRCIGKAGRPAGSLERIVVAGNPTMLHLLAGKSPRAIAVAPFLPEFTGRQSLSTSALGMDALPGDVPALLLPGVSGYVGADIVAGIVASGMSRRCETSLFLDLGTNGEIALGNSEHMLCCAAAAGPAFDGGGFACGSGGVEGAIDSVWLQSSGIAWSTIGEAPAVGLCGSGILDAAASFLDAGLLDRTGKLADQIELRRLDPSLAQFLDADEGRAYVSLDAGIYVSQRELRQLQLAKAAIAAGIELLLETAGIGNGDIHAVYLAGGFGSALDPKSAARLGLFPEALLDRITVVGNASGEGAAAACLSEAAMSECDRTAAICEYIELSTHPEFTERFVDRMEFGPF